MTMIVKCSDIESNCRCGRVGCKGERKVEIFVEKGHVRRAIVAANGVDRVAQGPEGPEAGVLLMTALLLVERLAKKYESEPHVLLAKMANCFELKRRHTEAPRRRN